jgi:anti-sigma factor (TIGR02949 family)
MNCDETRKLMHGYLDKEIDLARAEEIEKHLQGCAACKALYQRENLMQVLVRERARYYTAPAGLEARIRAALPKPDKKPIGFRQARLNWLSFAASLAFAVVTTWSVMLHFNSVSEDEHLTEEIISGHVRSLMVNHLSDIASSDRHTVKPWFNGKLDFSPGVIDLTSQGYPLVGGRLDYLNKRPVAALVYRHRQHFINLFIWPEESREKSLVRTTTRQGYNVLHWKDSGMVFWAVSDLQENELTKFVSLLQQPAPAK